MFIFAIGSSCHFHNDGRDDRGWAAGDLTAREKELDMNYLIWTMIGVVIAVGVGAQTRRRLFRPNTPILASAFGAAVGGVIGDGGSHAQNGDITILSLIGAVIGALIFCWAVRERASDSEP
jgi:uncharacterized membrane protein YeaQ/YmgE (transglycosylase-associated protein family)